MKRLLLTATLLAMPIPALADGTETCVWVQAENGNYLTVQNPECLTWHTGRDDHPMPKT